MIELGRSKLMIVTHQYERGYRFMRDIGLRMNDATIVTPHDYARQLQGVWDYHYHPLQTPPHVRGEALMARMVVRQGAGLVTEEQIKEAVRKKYGQES